MSSVFLSCLIPREELTPVWATTCSGDDHDHCDYTHPNLVREVTVKTFSMAMGVKTPGFQILSLVPPSATNERLPSHADMACNLPNQLGIYFNICQSSPCAFEVEWAETDRSTRPPFSVSFSPPDIPFTFITLMILLFLNVKKSYRRRRPAPVSILSIPSNINSNPTRHFTTPLVGTNPLKSPRLGSNSNLGMTPFASPNPTRRSSRSMPPSPTGSPRLSYHPSEPLLSEEPSSFAAESNTTASIPTPTRPSSFYLAGFHAAASQVDVEYASPSSPVTMEEGAAASSYFLPLPRTASGVGLGLLTPSTPSSRPGQVRKVSRIAMKEDTILPSTTRLSRGESIGIKEILTDFRRAVGVPRKVWGLVGGEESLAARWMKDVLNVFWPSWLAWIVLNGLYR